ncbi:hypothetical protein ES703_39800 [subsurface metagenome]
MIVRKKDAKLLIVYRGKYRMARAQQLTETAPKNLHSKGCFKVFCEAKLKMGIFGLIPGFGKLTVAQGQGRVNGVNAARLLIEQACRIAYCC